MSRVLSGGCLCGSVKYEIDGDLFMAAYCHCSMCRRAHGSAFRPRSLVWAKDFRWVQGSESIADYTSSPSVHRTFCRNCGSPLIAFSDQRDAASLFEGLLSTQTGTGLFPARNTQRFRSSRESF